MAMVITTNTVPLTTPRTTEFSCNPVHIMLVHFPILNCFNSSQTSDLEMANRFSAQIRGFVRAMPSQSVAPASLARLETMQAVIVPKKAGQKTTLRANGRFCPRLVHGQTSTSPSISL